MIIIGSNTAESHPVLATRVKSAHKLHGQKLIVVRSARERDGAARRSLPARQARAPIWSGCQRRQPLPARPRPREHGVHRSVGERPRRVSQEPRAVHDGGRLAHLRPAGRDARGAWRTPIADAKRMCILWAMGVTQHHQGSDTSTAISNLLLVTGNYMRPGTGAYPLRGHNNVQGASDNGSMPNMLPGYQSVDDPGGARALRSGVERDAADHQGPRQSPDGRRHPPGQAQGDVPHRRGDEHRRLERELRRARRSRSSTSSSCRTSSSARRAASPTSCCRPRRASRRKARSPAPSGGFSGSTRCSSRSTAAGRTGRSSRTSRTSSARAGTISIRPRSWTRSPSLTPLFAGVSYERLEGYKSLQWPVAADGTDEPLLYTKRFAFPDGKAQAVPGAVGRPDRCSRTRSSTCT